MNNQIKLSSVNCESEGRQKLINLGMTQAQIFKKTGIARQRINDYWQGKRKPDDSTRQLILTHLGIPMDTWDRLPLKNNSTHQPTTQKTQTTQTTDSQNQDKSTYDQRVGTLEAVRLDIHNLESIIGAGQITSNTIPSTYNTLRNYRETEAELLKELQDTETAWAQSTSFRELVDLIYEVLTKHPKALAEVRKTIEERIGF